MNVIGGLTGGETSKVHFRNLSILLESNDITIMPSLITGRYEKNELDWLVSRIRDLIPKKILFLDVGANVGIYSLVASMEIKNFGVVKAFEPTSENLEVLKKNISLNLDSIGDIEILDVALGNFEGVARLKIEKFKGLNYLTDQIEGTRQVEVKTLDSFCLQNKYRDSQVILKIDVEGFENQVILGAFELIEECNPDLILEVLPWASNLSDEVLDKLLKIYDEGFYFTERSRINRNDLSVQYFRTNIKYGNLILFKDSTHFHETLPRSS
jgi:FkbM family methyltransferase